MQSFDRLRMRGKRVRMKVLADEGDSKIKMRLPCAREHMEKYRQ